MRENHNPLGALTDRYMGLVSRVDPGRAVRWGRRLEWNGRLTYPDVQQITADIQRLQHEGGMLPASDPAAAMLRRSIQVLAFEWGVIDPRSTRPDFYADWRAGVLTEMLLERMADGEPPHDLRRWIQSYPSLVDSALSILRFSDLGKLDCLYSVNRLEYFRRLLEGEATKECPLGDLQAALEAAAHLRDVLNRTAAEARALSVPLGHRLLHDWLLLHSGIDVDLRRLEVVCRETLMRAKAPKADGRSTTLGTLSPSQLKVACERIALFLAPDFGDPTESLINLEFVTSAAPWQSVARAAYRSVGYVTGNLKTTVIFNSSPEGSQTQLELDLVHEVFPGHHWERTVFYRKFAGQEAALTYDSHPYVEGWAKYCEAYFAERAENHALSDHHACEQGSMALKALAAVLVHADGWSFAQVVATLRRLADLPESSIRSAAVDAYIHPLDNLAPMVGYLAVKKALGDSGNKPAHARFLERGPMSLWGVCL